MHISENSFVDIVSSCCALFCSFLALWLNGFLPSCLHAFTACHFVECSGTLSRKADSHMSPSTFWMKDCFFAFLLVHMRTVASCFEDSKQ